MYKMYNAQWNEESDRDSLNSSFWSDGEQGEEEEEEIQQMIYEEDSKPVTDTEDTPQEASEEEKPYQSKHGSISGESYEESKEEGSDEESCSSSHSMLTSGYGTYRPEEPEGAEHGDDRTVAEFDHDSQGDLFEMRDDEADVHSILNYGEKDTEPTHMTGFEEIRPGPDDGLHKEMDNTSKKSEEERIFCLHCTTEEEDKVLLHEKNLEGESVEYEKTEVLQLQEARKVEKGVEDGGEQEDPDESSSNEDIKFIDSKVDFSCVTYEEWKGNLRLQKDAASLLEERMEKLDLSKPPQLDDDDDDDDVTFQSNSQSSKNDRVSLSAFESYIRRMIRTDADLRPKPKSFIRPALAQQTLKKTDPVAKYFQYKQFWEMFKLPGETERRALRRQIKEQLVYQPPAPKPRRVYLPNTYVVPTEKKRSALRWEVRNDLANGLLPHKLTYRF
ncbi:hypothetical protein LDENG_00063020 [Lucifuga dentata]|nr:hypothetical protein LDENG_00063020 [Lucifuga dentata]